ncbi:MAG: hypothetical protein F6J98_10570 [Moorea sp. SIO4G2]|nr:hypothetical protein [Moorena sp. SIO4G2]
MSIGRMMASVLTYHLRLADGDKYRICLRCLKQLGMNNLGWWALGARLRWKWFGSCPAMPTLETTDSLKSLSLLAHSGRDYLIH